MENTEEDATKEKDLKYEKCGMSRKIEYDRLY